MKHLPILLITLIGLVLRFHNLGSNPFWIDEAWFGYLVQNGGNQEFIPQWFAQLFGLRTEFELRFFSALCGTLTIPAVYWVVKENKLALSLMVAVFPLFVFWSRMARPYAPAGLFVVLGWKYYWFYLPAILTTPISLIGIRILKQKWYVLLGCFVCAILFYLIRDDAGRNWTFYQITVSSRWFYVPILVAFLYINDFVFPFLIRIRSKLV